MIDDAARELAWNTPKIDKKNLIRFQLFRTTPLTTYDCGDSRQPGRALVMATSRASPRGDASKRGGAGGAARLPWSTPSKGGGGRARVRGVVAPGQRALFKGQEPGQGHETTFKHILHERLGLEPAIPIHRRRRTGRFGIGTWLAATSSRQRALAAAGGDRQGKKIAAKLRAADGDINVADGKLNVVSTDPRLGDSGGREGASCKPASAGLALALRDGHLRPQRNVPKAATLRGVVYPDTGAVTLGLRDCRRVGTVIPLTLKGQSRRVAQGVRSLMERCLTTVIWPPPDRPSWVRCPAPPTSRRP